VLSLVSPVRVAEDLAEEELDAFQLAILYTKIPPRGKKGSHRPLCLHR